MSRNWQQLIDRRSYAFVAVRGRDSVTGVQGTVDVENGLDGLRSYQNDREVVGLVIFANSEFPGSSADWSLQEARDSLNAVGYDITAIVRDRVGVPSDSASGYSFGEQSVEVYAVDVRPLGTLSELATARAEIVEIQSRHRLEAEAQARTVEHNREFTEGLGRALARMRKHEGWLEADRKDTMERRALTAEKRLSELEDSWTWRIGAAVLWLPRWILSLFTGGRHE